MKTIAVLFLFLTGLFSMNMSYMSEDVCAVDSNPLTAEHITYKYLNSEVKFCSEDCAEKFKTEPADYLKEVRCPVCDEDDAKKELTASTEGVKYYFCGKGCKTKFEKNSEKYLKNYNK